MQFNPGIYYTSSIHASRMVSLSDAMLSASEMCTAELGLAAAPMPHSSSDAPNNIVSE